MEPLINHAHAPGRHCASTSVADVLRFHGIPWGEAMCFGIGGGLGVYYGSLPGMSPSRLLHVRSGDFERRFFERIGVGFAWQRDEDPARAEAKLKEALAESRPAILLTDLYYLPYYQSKTHFPAHCIAAWGYDERKGVFYVSDTEREGLLEVPFDCMRKARTCVHPPIPHQGDFFAPDAVGVPDDLEGIIVESIVDNARELGDAGQPFQGLHRLNELSGDLAQWGDLENWQWTARFMYQIIEKRGTGGGGFRLMYADFLEQAAGRVPRVAERDLPRLMMESARAWQSFAMELKALSEQESPDTAEARSSLATVIEREGHYVAEAIQLAS